METKEVLRFTIWNDNDSGETLLTHSTYRIVNEGSNLHLEIRKFVDGHYKWERLDSFGWSHIGFLLSSDKFQNLFINNINK